MNSKGNHALFSLFVLLLLVQFASGCASNSCLNYYAPEEAIKSPAVMAPESPILGLEPFAIHSKSPFQLLRTSIEPHSPFCMDTGTARVRISSSWVNLWGLFEDKFLLDSEIVDTNINLRYSPLPCFELILGLQDMYYGGGALDSFIENFHKTFGFGTMQRPEYERNVVRILFEPEGGAVFSYASDAARMRRLRTGVFAGAKYKFLSESKTTPALSAMLYSSNSHKTAKWLPGKSNTMDWGWSIIGGKHFGQYCVYFNYGEAYFDDTSLGDVRLRDTQRNIFVSFERKVSEQTSLLIQSLYITKAAIDFPEISKPSLEAFFGMKYQFNKELLGEFAIIENIFEYFNSPDVGFYFGLTYMF